ncbi:MAG: citrate lyase holo-[acyl-carrier protein] synthase [Spirochaetales bacterium]|nr:citrate lyase holo-[acyl-carrier protein] synthase [Spirochaetales bacterium]
MAAWDDVADASLDTLRRALLEARERRAALLEQLFARWRTPVISLTLVAPGPSKRTTRHVRAARMGRLACLRALAHRQFHVYEEYWYVDAAGPVWLAAVEGAAEQIKHLAAGIEDSMAWGRLLDIDVLAPLHGEHGTLLPLHREQCSLPGMPKLQPRNCLVCSRPAQLCMASHRHTLAALEAACESLLQLADMHPVQTQGKGCRSGSLRREGVF